MIVGCYVLDLYCDEKNDEHKHQEFPHQYTGETGGQCREAARQEGWKLDLHEGRATCPKCTKRKR